MATTPTVAAPAPVAAPAAAAPAPAAPSSAPVTTPSSAPAAGGAPVTPATPAAAPVPAEATPTTPAAPVAPGEWKSKLKSEDYADREKYAAALIQERLGALKAPGEEAETQTAEPPKPAEVAAAEATPAETDNLSVDEAARTAVDLAQSYTPESFNQALKDNPEFAKALEANPALKNQLFKTAREAAEVAGFKKVFPDLKAAEYAKGNSSTFTNVRDTFLGSTTPEGAQKAARAIAELCYERDDQGNVVMENGQPVIGDDYFGFVNHIAESDLKLKLDEVKSKLAANRYRDEDERDQDERRQTALEVLMEDYTPASTAQGHGDVPEELKERFAEVERREREIEEKGNQAKVQERQTFETTLVKDANSRINGGIKGFFEEAKKQGVVIQPYIEKFLIASIGKKLADAAEADTTFSSQMKDLRRLPVGEDAKKRRLEVVDRLIQSLLPDIAVKELQEAGIHYGESQTAREAKIAAQVEGTKHTEPRGTTTPANPAGNPGQAKSVEECWKQATEFWQSQNPKLSPTDPGNKSAIIAIATRIRMGLSPA